MSNQDRLLSDEELDRKARKILAGYGAGERPLSLAKAAKQLLDLINTQKRLYAESVKEPLIKMLDTLGVEKCPVCSGYLIDDHMNICETCNYGVHEWCTGYTYDGDGEYPAESAYAICKNCYKPGELRADQRARIK